jgi:hypothetical protein
MIRENPLNLPAGKAGLRPLRSIEINLFEISQIKIMFYLKFLGL